MTKTTDILRAARDQLKQHYPAYKVYLDDVIEDIASPCFILKIMDTVKDDGNYRVYHDGFLYVTFFARKGDADAMQLYDIKDTLMATLVRGLSITTETGKRHINFSQVSTDTTGEDADIVQMTLPYTFFDTLDAPAEGYLIENVFTDYK